MDRSPCGQRLDRLAYTVATPGTYDAKAVVTGSWDAFDPDGRGENAANIDFATVVANQPVQIAANLRTGQANILPIAPATPPPPPPPVTLTYAIIHYNRPAGDYDGWGLHMWTGYDSATGGAVEWATPFLPTGEDAFGKVYQVPVVTSAGGLAYIMHNGDAKDLPSDQYLDFAQDGFEVWLLQGTPGYLLPVK